MLGEGRSVASLREQRPLRPTAHPRSATQPTPAPLRQTAVQPPADHRAEAVAEPAAPPRKLQVTKAVLRRLRACGASANNRVWLRMLTPCTAMSSSTTAIAVFGTIFTDRLDDRLRAALTGQARSRSAAALEADPRAVAELPPGLRPSALHAYAASITDVFLYAAPVVLLAFALAWLLREDGLRGSVTAPDMAQTLSVHPVHRSLREEVQRALSLLGSRDGRRGVYEKISAEAGYDLRPASSWLLLRALRPERSLSPARLAEYSQVPLPVIQDALDEIRQRGLATREGMDLILTDAGREAAARLSAARQDSFAELLGDWWGPDQPTDLVELVEELSSQLSGSDKERPHVPAPRARVRRTT